MRLLYDSFCFFVVCVLFFFVKQKTAYEMRISDWSSDVCSSDLNTRSRFSQFPLKSGMSVSSVVSGLSRRMAFTVSAHTVEPPSLRSSRSTEVMAQCFTSMSFTELATRLGSSKSTASGRPVATAQKEQERVQMFPNIMNVAVPAPSIRPYWGNCHSHRWYAAYARQPNYARGGTLYLPAISRATNRACAAIGLLGLREVQS